MTRRLRKLKRIVRRIAPDGRPIVLMYHRVARLAVDPWRLAVTPEHFAEQIGELVRLRRVVPLRDLVTAVAHGRPHRALAAVTFDDGYADVFTNAKPVLERLACPATVFVATGTIGRAREFWWDELSRILLESPTLPDRLTLEIAGRRYRWRLSERLIERPQGACPSQDEETVITRGELHNVVWEHLRTLPLHVRERHLDSLAAWAGSGSIPRAENRPMTAAEVRALGGGLIEIGAHSVTHPCLPALGLAEKRREIVGSRRACEDLIGSEVHSFAYPYGDHDPESIGAVREAGFSVACATGLGVVTAASDPFRLPRVAIDDWDGRAFARRLAAAFGAA